MPSVILLRDSTRSIFSVVKPSSKIFSKNLHENFPASGIRTMYIYRFNNLLRVSSSNSTYLYAAHTITIRNLVVPTDTILNVTFIAFIEL
jgi:hypothetical protein